MDRELFCLPLSLKLFKHRSHYSLALAFVYSNEISLLFNDYIGVSDSTQNSRALTLSDLTSKVVSQVRGSSGEQEIYSRKSVLQRTSASFVCTSARLVPTSTLVVSARSLLICTTALLVCRPFH